uniref:Uncharacterized protein n=1 Tax=Arundo donax TaxID=35708 RepID=A0A0A8XMT0_ARUDO
MPSSAPSPPRTEHTRRQRRFQPDGRSHCRLPLEPPPASPLLTNPVSACSAIHLRLSMPSCCCVASCCASPDVLHSAQTAAIHPSVRQGGNGDSCAPVHSCELLPARPLYQLSDTVAAARARVHAHSPGDEMQGRRLSQGICRG